MFCHYGHWETGKVGGKSPLCAPTSQETLVCVAFFKALACMGQLFFFSFEEEPEKSRVFQSRTIF
jgi:hypothetical protein